jgi:hypothetical protein
LKSGIKLTEKNDKKKEKKVKTPQEQIIIYRTAVENMMIKLAKLDEAKSEEIYFCMAMFKSIFSPSNPSLYQRFVKNLGGKD